MKLDFDEGMDALLRNLPDPARAAADASADPARRVGNENAPAVTAHLDADELSAYAENALPAATRARYVAHLADCETCRRLATNIAMAADVAGALERSDSTEPATVKAAAVPSGWRAWLVSFFSPRVLLYAAPALAVLVAGTALFMMTQTRRRGAGQVAQVIPTGRVQSEDAVRDGRLDGLDKVQEQPRATAVSEPTPGAVSQGNPPAVVAPAPSARQAGEPEKDETFADAARNGAAAPSSAPAAPPTVSEGVSLSSTETKQAQKTAEDDAVRVERETVTTPSTATPPVKEKATAPAKEEAREKRVEEVAVTGGSKVANAPSGRNDQTDSRDARPADAERQSRRAEDLAMISPAAPKTERKSAPSTAARRSIPPARSDGVSESSGETRSVAGRQFRRQGGAWVDTSYKGSTSLTNVTRGSEQYRALVADEPELRRVAEQLGGEVIVLWKSRAYRIK